MAFRMNHNDGKVLSMTALVFSEDQVYGIKNAVC